MHTQDRKLQSLLRGNHSAPPLPPRFQENVWRRIEAADVPVQAGETSTWLEALVALILRPRFAYTTVAVLMLAGMSLGAYHGVQTARHDAEARYVASVAPNSLR